MKCPPFESKASSFTSTIELFPKIYTAHFYQLRSPQEIENTSATFHYTSKIG